MDRIEIKIGGYIDCKSMFYSVADVFNSEAPYKFSAGINRLYGEIDSGVFGISYLISMYNSVNKDLIYGQPEANVDENIVPLSELTKYACYLDESYPLFKTRKSVRKMVSLGLKKNKSIENCEQLRDMFMISKDRFERPLYGVGNERFKAMAAIAYAFNKEIFCFPWLSKNRFDYFRRNMTDLLDILASLNKIVIVPTGY